MPVPMLNGSTSAVKNEDGSYTLTGSKVFNTNGEADITAVFADGQIEGRYAA